MPLERWTLQEALTRLRKEYGAPQPPIATDPFEVVLWESCAYLVDDEHRARVFARLKKATGFKPERIAAMRPEVLAEVIAADGGMQPSMRAAKLQRAADIGLDIGLRKLRGICRSDPRRARNLIKRFPGFADPGAERVLMVSGSLATLGLESNGVRVLLRLGYGTMQKDWIRTWGSVSAAVMPEVPKSVSARIAAHQLLRAHGRTLCKTTAPHCGECPLLERCPMGRSETRRT